MNASTQEQMLAVLNDLFQEQPDMRFGQMIASLALFARGPIKSAVWEVEDQELLAAAQRHLHSLRQRREAKEEVKQLVAAQTMKSAA